MLPPKTDIAQKIITNIPQSTFGGAKKLGLFGQNQKEGTNWTPSLIF